MRRALCAISSALVILAVCACFAGGGDGDDKRFMEALPSLFAPANNAGIPRGSTVLRVWAEDAGGIIDMELERYVAGVVLYEMPMSYAPEALKAQAVAARTYALNKSHLFKGAGCARREGADICTSSGCCQGYAPPEGDAALSAREAAAATRGMVCAFRSSPIRAMYHACSGGHTEDAENVYAGATAYLRGVPSKGEEEYKQYSAETLIGFQALIDAFRDHAEARVIRELSLEEQFEVLERSDTGRVTQMRVGLARVSGSEFRRALNLKSSMFFMEFREDGIMFITQGYGHGVGMSQVGADAMARAGADCAEILDWYYTGVELVNFTDIINNS